MTDGNPRPEEEQRAPTSAEDAEPQADTGDDGLAAPFVPGGGSTRAEPETVPDPTAAEPSGPEPAPDASPPTEPDTRTPEPEPAGAEADEPFPFEKEDEPEDEFPFEAFDIEGEGGGEEAEGAPGAVEPEPETEVGTEKEPEAGDMVAEPPPASTGALLEVADRLEALGHRLREQGPGALETEMRSSDRLTALLAGLLAGYLAGRE